MLADETGKKAEGGRQTRSPEGLPMLDVRELVSEGRELVLVHNGEHYRLRITSKGKLILTK